MPRYPHPEDGRVYACPDCDSYDIYHRTHEGRDYQRPFSCRACYHEFEEPIERDEKHGGGYTETPDGIPVGIDDRMKSLIRDARGD